VLSILFFYNVGAVGDKKAKPSSEEDTLAMEPTPSDEKRAIL
jgi:hypothetical protein